MLTYTYIYFTQCWIEAFSVMKPAHKVISIIGFRVLSENAELQVFPTNSDYAFEFIYHY